MEFYLLITKDHDGNIIDERVPTREKLIGIIKYIEKSGYIKQVLQIIYLGEG